MIALAAMAGAEPQNAPPPPPRLGKVLQPLSPGSWVTNDDYPAAAMRAHAEGRVGFRVAIDAKGQVTGCTIIISSGSPVLDEATCALLRRRARFVPAEDARGVPIPATYQNRVAWEIPDEAAPFKGWAIIYRFHLSAAGEISDCTAESTEGGSLSNVCAQVWDLPEAARTTLRGAAGKGVAVETREWQQLDGSPPPVAAEAPGARIVYLRRTHVLVGEDGKVVKCEVLQQSGTDVMELAGHDCHPGYQYPGAGQVDAAHRGATVVISATTRPL